MRGLRMHPYGHVGVSGHEGLRGRTPFPQHFIPGAKRQLVAKIRHCLKRSLICLHAHIVPPINPLIISRQSQPPVNSYDARYQRSNDQAAMAWSSAIGSSVIVAVPVLLPVLRFTRLLREAGSDGGESGNLLITPRRDVLMSSQPCPPGGAMELF
ncbi:uncharacterized protein B0H64DRAFT_200784 [Chaetomium fimeti]|uniref:Uncharacterized protein n=1 Tax=Chaetomium fimeti TaxID=1854472 RepID=A0AAE0LSB5_9PEZI|nr:hypothetical protein B0H64DRAFT_200784 [Chaetomium fimeti]